MGGNYVQHIENVYIALLFYIYTLLSFIFDIIKSSIILQMAVLVRVLNLGIRHLVCSRKHANLGEVNLTKLNEAYF